ncbi:MAG TPA: sporulation protein YqfC [Firmicutes bacterium]|nr:sporulation protein YqfC [Bacillota bacterium]
MGQRKKVPVAHKLADFLDIPLDTVIDWPRMTLSGNKNLTIINHRGVIEYDQTLVRINTRFGELKISGSGLTLVSAVKDEVVVDGKINQLEWIDWR